MAKMKQSRRGADLTFDAAKAILLAYQPKRQFEIVCYIDSDNWCLRIDNTDMYPASGPKFNGYHRRVVLEMCDGTLIVEGHFTGTTRRFPRRKDGTYNWYGIGGAMKAAWKCREVSAKKYGNTDRKWKRVRDCAAVMLDRVLCGKSINDTMQESIDIVDGKVVEDDDRRAKIARLLLHELGLALIRETKGARIV
jgi:hypothetical protein